MSNTPKHVVSSMLQTLDWGPASLVRGDLAEELEKLKQQPGQDIHIPGSPRLVRSLLRCGLLDELALGVVQIVVGSGMRLFEQINEQVLLEFVESCALSTGVLALTYRSAR